MNEYRYTGYLRIYRRPMWGNPTGVVLDADRFSNEEMQRIAAAVGLSETAFASRSSEADVKLEFFTPTQQIAAGGRHLLPTTCLTT